MKVKLLKFEQNDLMRANSITKLCFFDGNNDDVYDDVKKRTLKLLESNPWLGSKLVKEKKEIKMEFDESIAPQELLDKILSNDTKLCIDDSLEYSKMLSSIKNNVVGTGKELVKTGELVTKISLLSHKINNTSGLVVLFSISHVVADGYTYYKLLNAFFDPSQISVMNYRRKFEAVDKIEDFIGKINYNFVSSAAMIINVLKNMLFGKKNQYFSRFVDEQKVNTLKETYANDRKSKFPFISTNDVITSHFCRATNSRLALSAINLRNRIEGVNNEDAGNYEFVLLLDKKHYQTPEAIRKVLSSKGKFKANNGKMPSIIEALRSNITVITNASSFIEDYCLGDLKQILHLPVFKPEGVYCDFAAVYKTKDNKRAVFYFGKNTSAHKYLENSALGETVSQSLFR